MAAVAQAPPPDAQNAAPAVAAAAADPNAKKDAPAPAPAAGEKKLSGAELKARAKAEKAARRATKVVAQQASAAAAEAKGGKSKQKQDGPHVVGGKGKPAASGGAAPVAPAKKVKGPTVPECFSHLAMAKRVTLSQADRDVHPAVLLLGQQMSAFVVRESTRRLEATLLALKKVIESYTTPAGSTLSRHITSHVLNPQIEYLTESRPMCFSMGNAIRWLKLRISEIDMDISDEDAKKRLCEGIDAFVREKITMADGVIVESAAEEIQDGDVVVTYASNPLVKRALLRAHRYGKKYRVVVVDDVHDRSGTDMAKALRAAGLDVTYCPDIAGSLTMMRHSTKTIVAAEAVFSNGAVYARAGTCDLAQAAADANSEMIVLCESINFTERMATDSLTYNEIDPELGTDAGFRLLFDTTTPAHVSTILSEHGGIRPHMVPGILKRMEFL
ncbi:related to translation initiation factor eIF2B, 71 kDa (delta) subunit [Cephalotrichum gorgonifer]|uniref:Translation initiation factor eIF2B subunit delta n=1 Tax=Cephalotrichum gorgonifer TaxID=2041049 RepID=A0AAE8N600_9PEZI|nr:related to translation initiation factor eIF2B, 71 kDa (delta) subunit [Cephalotrichum gorgonifer]